MSHIVGVDPGLVHTGVVSYLIYPDLKRIDADYFVAENGEVHTVAEFLEARDHWLSPTKIFIEQYRPRSHFSTDAQMTVLVREFATRLPWSQVIDNTGIKSIVKKPLLGLLKSTKFPTTHHNDLLSAARIAVLGMLKDDKLNELLTTVVKDSLNGRTWDVRTSW